MSHTTLPAAQQIAQRLDTALATRGHVLVIGLGGVGLPLARAIATFLAGLCFAIDALTVRLVLCDGDGYLEENTYRMDIPGLGNKAGALGADLLERFTCPNFLVRWVAEYVTPANVGRLIQDHDCVLLACDNHATRHLVGQHCAALPNVTLISGGNDGVEEGLRGTYGNVQVHVRRNGQDWTAPLDRFHPEIAHPQDRSPHDMSCLELVSAGVPQILFVNLAVASAMCNALLRLMMAEVGQPMYDEVGLDILDAVSMPHWLS
jgi:predicted ThiF/HesA family dinucleotide-utilizing enzyme